MPMPYTMPQIPNRYPLDKNDKLGLLIGTLLSSGLAAAGSNNTGESPWLRGVAGATAGFGAGGKAINDSYSAMLDDYLKNEAMNFRNRQMTQEQQQFQDTLGLNREKFGEEKRQFEESEKPYRESQMKWNEAMSKNLNFDNQMAFDKMIQERLNKKKDERFDTRMQQLEMRKKKNDVVNSRPRNEKTYSSQAQFESMYGLKPDQRGTPEYLEKFKEYKLTGKSENNWDALWLGGEAGSVTKQPPQTQQVPQQGDAIARHQNDPAMQGTELGKLTPQGYEVYKNGKLVGHYQ